MKEKSDNQNRNKEYYQLWWEYLRRSNNYKQLCERICVALKKKGQEPATFSKPDTFPKRGLFYKEIDDRMMRGYELKNRKDFSKVDSNLFERYNFFGDIYVNTFEEWWAFKAKLWQASYALWSKNIMKEFYPKAEVVKCAESIDTLAEFKKHIEYCDEFENEKHCFIKIKMPPFMGVFKDNTEEINLLVDEFAEIIKKKVLLSFLSSQPRTKKSLTNLYIDSTRLSLKNRSRKNVSLPDIKPLQPRLRAEELWKYLEVYDCRQQGLAWKEIIQKYDEDESREDIRIAYSRFYSKAVKIMHGAEAGTFPDYGDKARN